ncbi:InlB B-repeat-containing protein [Bariatricus sp. SGI.154]|uniref:InlB B-repeat-containing protein n=1 Tax=Bariatricus sp. SGI.154 TaxID=3420549 RepID=UPI003CFE6460
MKKKLKQLASVLIALALLVTVIPATALADDYPVNYITYHELRVPVGYSGEMEFNFAYNNANYQMRNIQCSSDNAGIANANYRMEDNNYTAVVTISGVSEGTTEVDLVYTVGRNLVKGEAITVTVYTPPVMKLDVGGQDDFISQIYYENTPFDAGYITMSEDPHVIDGAGNISVSTYNNSDRYNINYGGTASVAYTVTGTQEGAGNVKSEYGFYATDSNGFTELHMFVDVLNVEVAPNIICHELRVPVGYNGEIDLTCFEGDGYLTPSNLTATSADTGTASVTSEVTTVEGIPAAAVTIEGEKVGNTQVTAEYDVTDSNGARRHRTEIINVEVYDAPVMELEINGSDEFVSQLYYENSPIGADEIYFGEEPHVLGDEGVISIDHYADNQAYNITYEGTGSVGFSVIGNKAGKDTVKSEYAFYENDASGNQTIHMFVDVLNVTVKKPETFTLVHSSDGTKEDLSIEEYCFPDYVKEGYLYGGFYKDAELTQPYTEEELDEPGIFTPEAGTTIYLKEVSEDYLGIKSVYTTTNRNNMTGTGELYSVFLYTAVDNKNYQEVGFVLDGDFDHLAGSKTVYSGCKITEFGTNKTVANYGLKDIFKTLNQGYLGVHEIKTLQDGDTLEVCPYWITPDGVMVHGLKDRTLTVETESDKKKVTAVDSECTNRGGDIMSLDRVFSTFSLDVQDCYVTQPENEKVKITKVEGDSFSIQDVTEPNMSGKVTCEEKEGQIFAGWYTDDKFAAPADFSNVTEDMTVYAKYISSDYLAVKIQEVKSRGIVTQIKTFTAVDGKKNYAEIGFMYNVAGNASNVIATKTTTKIGGKNAAQLFGENVESSAPLYYNNLNVEGLEKGSEITITPYWITKDGTTVTGPARSFIYQTKSVTVK